MNLNELFKNTDYEGTIFLIRIKLHWKQEYSPKQ